MCEGRAHAADASTRPAAEIGCEEGQLRCGEEGGAAHGFFRCASAIYGALGVFFASAPRRMSPGGAPDAGRMRGALPKGLSEVEKA